MNSTPSRREFLATTSAIAVGWRWGIRESVAAEPDREPAQTALPRWKGFNLTNFFQAFSDREEGQGLVVEDDYRWIRDWGFDFVRLPMDYWLWVDSNWNETRKLSPDDVLKIRESTLEKVDRAIDLGRKHGVHVSLNFHRAPGYCINNPEREPYVLWQDVRAEEAFAHHWRVFAERYRGISNEHVSFNLLNEAPTPRDGYMTRDDYARVMNRAIDEIREVSPDRTIIVDGLNVGNVVVDELIPAGVAQSVHGYRPAEISHYRASWVDRGNFREPTWPLRNANGTLKLDRAGLERAYAPWGDLARQGIGVHCGECGGYNKTPYPVFIAWMEDVLDILKGHGIGYALWNFRGSFGVLDSGRTDIDYVDWHGHQLDKQLLTLLQKY
jgi:endoglucanase